jgi:hypothetical protein
MNEKPLFIPLKGEYYDQFLSGTKKKEFRIYGSRWNEKTCLIGRSVTISRGYGKKHRACGMITAFARNAPSLSEAYEDLKKCYTQEDLSISMIA